MRNITSFVSGELTIPEGEYMKVVIFDMDGTLIDTSKDITITVNHVRALHHDLPPLTSDEVVEMINRPDRNLPKLFYGTDTYEADDKALFETHYYEQCIRHPRLYEGIKETLMQLKEREIRLSVATNAPSIFARRMLNHLEVDKYFDHIIGPDIVTAPKPDPGMLHYILETYHYQPRMHHAWMVGDNQKDMLAAMHAGIQSVFATWGFVSIAQGDMKIDTPQTLIEIVTVADK